MLSRIFTLCNPELRRWRIGLSAVAALLAVLTGVGIDAAPVWAQVADPEGSRIVWACWRTGDGSSSSGGSNSGNWKSPGWGYGRGYVIEGKELAYSAVGSRGWEVENRDQSLPDGEYFAYYSSLREFMDYTFFVHVPENAADVARSGTTVSDIARNDVRRRLMLRLLVPGMNDDSGACGGPDGDHLECDYEGALTGHWLGGASDTREEFLKQRLVMSQRGENFYGEETLVGVSASWEDLDSTDGGAAVDHAAIVSQQLAGQQDFDLTTQGYITGGSERALTTDEEIVQTVTVTTDTRCSGGQSCTSHTSSSSGFQTRDTTDVTVETVDQEVLRQNRTPDGVNPNRLGPGGQPVAVGREGPGIYNLDERAGRQEGFSDFDYSDTNSDVLYVELALDPTYREDFVWEAGDYFNQEVTLRSFGGMPWAYRGYGPNLSVSPEDFYPLVGGHTERGVQDTLGIFPSGSYGWRVPFLESLNGTNDDVAHIRWPVNFADLNWYLYEVTTERGDQSWLRMLHPRAQERMVEGGYVRGGPVPDGGDYPQDYPGTCSYRDDLEGRDVVCGTTSSGGNFTEEAFGVNHFFLPFDRASDVVAGTDATPLLSSAQLRRAGVATPLDAEATQRRDLTHFGFTISDQSPLPAAALEEGANVGFRYALPGRQRSNSPGFAASPGVPAAAAGRWPYQDNRVDYLRNWPAHNLVPDRGHLLVVTYYESYRQDGEELTVKIDIPFGDDKRVEYPKRSLRKVLCRIYVPPIGVTSAEQEGIWLWSWFKDKGGEVIELGTDVMARIVLVTLRSLLDVSQSIVGGSARVACTGMAYLDQAVRLEVGGGSEPVKPTATYGVLRLSEVEANRNDGLGRCRRISEREEIACDFDGSVVFRRNCSTLPTIQPYLRSVDFVTPNKSVSYTEYTSLSQTVGTDSGRSLRQNGYSYEDAQGRTQFAVEVPRVFLPSYSIGDGNVALQPNSKGLARVEIGWNFLHTGDNPVPVAEIDGVVVELWLDPKVDPAVTGEDVYRFFLPRAIEREYRDNTDGGRIKRRFYPVDSFSFGALGYYDEDEAGGPGAVPSTPLVQVAEPRRYVTGDFVDQAGSRLIVASGQAIQDAPNFERFLENLPVAPGFRYRIGVRAFEHDPIGGLVYGPSGTVLVVDGDRAACLDEESDENTVYHVPRDDDWHLARQLYDCDGSSTLGSARRPGAVDVARLGEYGLLSPLQMDICKDLFSTTPPGFTWDNPVVKQVWSLAWVLAGGVLFVLLVWQGLRMTYDWWIDPSPSTGFRELVPRFLLAFSLASVSLYICQLVLILAADATCFVAQHTGITMWGMWGTTMGGMFEGYVAWSEQLIGELDERSLDNGGVGSVIRGILLALGMFLVMIVFIVVLLYFFVKVAIAMLLRLALLAVLCALSPMAFAMYASESTAHWTRTWVSMFLGVTFQQVVTLVVIFLGGQFMGNFLQEGDGTNFTLMIVSLVLSVLILGLADKVPDLVNPSGRGLFSSAGTALKMGTGAAVVGGFGLASLGGGLVGGAALGAARGATVGARNTYGGISGFVTGFRGGAQGTSGGDGGGDDGSGGGGSAPSGGGPGASPAAGGSGGTNVSPAAGGSSGGGWGAGLRGARAGFMGGSGQSSGEESPGGQGSGSQAAAGQSSGGGSSGRGGQPSVGRRLVESNPVTGVAAGAIGGALSGLRRGAVAGIQRGQSMNNRFENVARGHFLYRHRGVQDDAAARMERQQRLRQQQPAAAQDFSQGFASRLAEAMVEAHDKAAARQAAAHQGNAP